MPDQSRVPAAGTWVPGYTKKDGTRVDGYYRGAPSGGNVGLTASRQQQTARLIAQSANVRKRKG